MKVFKNIIICLIMILCSLSLSSCNNVESNEKNKTDYMILVNKQNKLPDDWESKIDLVEVYTGLDETYQLEKKTAEAYEKLRNDLRENDHVIIELDSTYRTVKNQQEIWNEFLEEYGEEYTKKYVAVPGTSEHHTGLVIDVKIVKEGKIISDNDEMTKETEIFSKIHSKLAKYGFILRYPVGKEDITGYGSEVWHFRYIDNPSIAKEIMDKKITFEEYLQDKNN
ncbi:MAG: M15 family metallopeptidase [Bacilli bacterium]|nr:M15 family metallopeptidase [Bacilli bacterium]